MQTRGSFSVCLFFLSLPLTGDAAGRILQIRKSNKENIILFLNLYKHVVTK
nr:MAG TPA: hypothetical protein [Bacteriophage sp.]